MKQSRGAGGPRRPPGFQRPRRLGVLGGRPGRPGRLLAAVLLAVIGVLAPWSGSGPVAAGGWVVISVDSGIELRAGEASAFGFTVLRHGTHPETWEEGLVVDFIAADGTRQRFDAVASGAEGHHVATVELAEPGDYRYRVTATHGFLGGGADEALPITVFPAAAAAPAWRQVAPPAAGGLAIVLAIAAVLNARRQRSPRPVAA